MKISFIKSLIIGLLIIFGVNFYYIINNVVPNRITLTLFVTSVFVGLYALFFSLISRKILSHKNNYFMILFNAILSLIFLSIYSKIQFYFQNEPFINYFLHLGYVPIAPYLFLIVFGILLYIPLILFLERKNNNIVMSK